MKNDKSIIRLVAVLALSALLVCGVTACGDQDNDAETGSGTGTGTGSGTETSSTTDTSAGSKPLLPDEAPEPVIPQPNPDEELITDEDGVIHLPKVEF